MGSLFSGSGGFELAASLCGIEPVWASEIEPYPIAVTRSRFTKMEHMGDVSKINGADIEPVDIVTFGSPCTDMSLAGRRAGLDGRQSVLFYQAIRIIKEMRCATNGKYPRYCVWENVPGAFSSNKGEDFRTVLEELIKIVEPTAVMPAVPKSGWPNADNYCGDGWSLAYRVFDAQYWGVPQRRRRIYLALDLGGGCAGKVLFEREGVRRYFEKSREAWKKFAGRYDDSAGAYDSRKCRVVYSFDARGNGDGDTVSTITGDHENRITDYTSCLIETDPTYCMATGQANAEILKEQSPCLNCDHEQPIVFPRDRISYSIRRLTPMECARLQGFPDDWGVPDSKDVLTDDEYVFWSDVRKTHAKINGKPIKNYTKEQMLSWYKKLHTDTSEYKMWGNGIALPCALYCMQGILDCLEDGYGEESQEAQPVKLR